MEELALSYYGTLGYKGYHSENSILATLFGLLFWDILFSPQPGVFETSYQTEPLDLRTDAFFLGRQQMIMDRLESIAKSTITEYLQDSVGSLGEDHMIKSDTTDENGGVDEEGTLVRSSHRRAKTDSPIDIAPVEHVKQEQVDETIRLRPEMKVETEDAPLARKRRECFYLNQLQTIDDLYREKKVFCVGVNWTFEKEELLQIAEVRVCKMPIVSWRMFSFINLFFFWSSCFSHGFNSVLVLTHYPRYARSWPRNTVNVARACLIYGNVERRELACSFFAE